MFKRRGGRRKSNLKWLACWRFVLHKHFALASIRRLLHEWAEFTKQRGTLVGFHQCCGYLLLLTTRVVVSRKGRGVVEIGAIYCQISTDGGSQIVLDIS